MNSMSVHKKCLILIMVVKKRPRNSPVPPRPGQPVTYNCMKGEPDAGRYRGQAAPAPGLHAHPQLSTSTGAWQPASAVRPVRQAWSQQGGAAQGRAAGAGAQGTGCTTDAPTLPGRPGWWRACSAGSQPRGAPCPSWWRRPSGSLSACSPQRPRCHRRRSFQRC